MPSLLIPSRRRPKRPERLRRAAAALGLAVACHFAFLAVILFLSMITMNVPKYRGKVPPPRPVTLRPLTADQWAQNRGKPPARSAPERESALAKRQETPKERKAEERPRGQVVDTAPGNGEAPPDDAKYLAERNNKVAKESRAKEQTAFYRNAMPRRSSSTPQQSNGNADRMQIVGNNGMANDDRPLRDKSAKNVFEVPDIKRRQEVAMRENKQGDGPGTPVQNRSESAEVVGNSNRLKIQPGAPGDQSEEGSAGKRGTPGIANLVPSYTVLDKLSGAAPNDHLADVDEGEGTYLNTKEWKYSTFFNRVKQSVGMHWDPGTQLRMRDPSLNIYGGKDRFTILTVALNEKGMVKEIFVEKSCGVDFLDMEAIASFQRAQPFPNPPPGLLAADSTVRFQFGFFLELGSGPRLRLFRGNN